MEKTLLLEKPLKKNISLLSASKLISTFGSSFSSFILPLFAYEISKSPIHTGMQWAIIAFSQLLAATLTPYLGKNKKIKVSLISLDITLAVISLFPLFFYKSFPLLATYTTSFLVSFLFAIHRGFFDSSIGTLSNDKAKEGTIRNIFFGKTATGTYIGQLLGFSLAGLVSTKFGFKIAFLIDSFTYICSAFLISLTTIDGINHHNTKSFLQKNSFSVILNKSIIFLTLGQILTAFSVFILNGSYIFILKHNFEISNYMMSVVFSAQFCFAIMGATFFTELSKRNKISENYAFISRLLIAFCLLSFSFITTINHFILVYSILNFLISFSLPQVQSLFLKNAENDDILSISSGRIAATSLAGTVGAVVGSTLVNTLGMGSLFEIAFLFAFIGAISLQLHLSNPRKQVTC